MASKNYIKDIQMFINEAYSDKEPLQENQIKSKQVFNDYCNEISQALDRLEKLEKIFSDSHICEIKARFKEIECSADKCDNCPLGIGDGICLKKTFERKWELQKENQELIRKADCCLWKDCNKISQENQDLKRKYENRDFLYQNEVSKNGNLAGKIFEKDLKIQKLEKAIEILFGENGAVLLGSDNKHKLHLIDYDLVKYFISKENYYLLNEALNERGN